MNSIIYLFRFLYRIRFWLILCPTIVALIVIFGTRHLSPMYEVRTTIYTGVASGYDIETNEGTRHDWNIINNAMDNLINIITSQTTLKNVSMRLFTQHLMYGDPERDNNYITAHNYRTLISKTPKDVLALVDKTSEERTLENLFEYEKASRGNHVYGLFNYTHRHYSYDALRKIVVKRQGNSDMLEVSYQSDDPGIAYNTLMLLNEEFVVQYKNLRFGETDNVIKYFEEELVRTRSELKLAEDSLRDYNVDKRVINYDEQTKHIAALSRDFELRFEEILLDYRSAEKLVATLEARMDAHMKSLRNNSLFVDKLNAISDLTTRIATLETMHGDSIGHPQANIGALRRQLQQTEEDLTEITSKLAQHDYTKEGLSTSTLVSQWLDVLIRYEKAKAQLKVMDERKLQLDNQYVYFSPIGSTIKRKEREINFKEQSYLSILHGLNMARLKKRSLQMSSATLKIINPPTYPVSSLPTKRKLMVLVAFFGTLVFVIAYFILIELLDRTLRDKIRTERITSMRVLGAFPSPGRLRNRSYSRAAREQAAQFMGNAVLGFLRPEQTNLINILSTEPGTGKSFLLGELRTYLEGIGLRVFIVDWKSDFDTEHPDYLMAKQLDEFIKMPSGSDSDWKKADVVLIEYPPLSIAPMPAAILDQGVLNVVVARADRVWKDMDQLLMEKIVDKSGQTPVYIYLNQARWDAVEVFTGMLPPYGWLRRLIYRFGQFGLTGR